MNQARPRWQDAEREPGAHEARRRRCGSRAGSREIRRVVRQRRERDHRYQERHAEPAKAVAEKHARAFPLQTVPDEHAREQEHQRHEEDVVERDQQRKPHPPRLIDHGKCESPARLGAERHRRRRRERVIGEDGMMGDHQHGDERAQVPD
jgi:hypothetical protein